MSESVSTQVAVADEIGPGPVTPDPTPTRRPWWDSWWRAPLLPMVASGLVTAPVLRTPLVGDDQINFLSPWILESVHMSPWTLAWNITRGWVTNQGRFYPLAQIFDVWLFRGSGLHITLYKAVLFALIIAAVASFVAVVSVVTGDRRLAIVAGLFVAPMFEIQWTFFDPLTSFGGLLPLTFALACLSVALAWKAAHAEGRRVPAYAIGAGVLAAASLLTYETMGFFLVAGVVLLFIRYRLRSRAARWATLGLAIPLVLELVTTVVLLVGRRAPASAYTTNFEPGPVAHAFLRQVSGTVPMSQGLASHDWQVRFGNATDSFGPKTYLFFALCGLVLVGIGALTWRSLRSWRPEAWALVTAGLLGATIVLGPALLTAVTYRWQVELVDGVGYLSVFHQYFGLALVLAGLLGAIALRIGRSRPGRYRAMLIVGFAVWVIVTLLVMTSNWAYVADQRDVRTGQELLYDRAPELRDQLSARDVVVMAGAPGGPVIWQPALRGATGIHALTVVNAADDCREGRRCFELVIDVPGDQLVLRPITRGTSG